MRISERVGIRLILVIGGLTAALLMTGLQKTANAGRTAATAFGDTSGAGHVLPADAR